MRIGIVCPYAFDAPGGVQVHVSDLTRELRERGHFVSVLAPGIPEDAPEGFVSAGDPVPIKFNGSVARLAFGPRIGARTRAWLDAGDFDVLHIHEPGSPSVGLHALMNADVPVVATFHAALDRSIVRKATSGLVDPYLERIAVRIAVSNEARRTLIEHHSGDAVIIPNGVFCQPFADAKPKAAWEGTRERPVIVFLGRLDEPRKGLEVFAGAIDAVLAQHPGARFLVAGRGNASCLDAVSQRHPGAIEVLGEITDAEKQSLLAGATIYVAPQLGGESFGIVIVEAMSAGTAVVASDLTAFSDVLDGGRRGWLFPVGDSEALAKTLNERLSDPLGTESTAAVGKTESWRYDWGTVSEQVLAAYQAAVGAAELDEASGRRERGLGGSV